MDIKVTGIMAVDTAEINVDGIALITGLNEAGKSTVCEAVSAALVRDPVIRGVGAKNRLGAIVRGGYDRGVVVVANSGGQVAITYPEGKVEASGTKPPQSSDVAAGLRNIMVLSSKERAEALIDILKAVPSRKDFTAEMEEKGIDKDFIGKTWDVIEDSDSWDHAHQRFKERGIKIKGQWEAITHARYGLRVGENWIPDGWDEKLGKASLEGLEACVVEGREGLEKAIAEKAVSGSEVAIWERTAADEKDLAAKVAELEESVPELEEAFKKQQAIWGALPTPEAGSSFLCPYGSGDDASEHCKSHWMKVVKDGMDYRAMRTNDKPLPKEELEKRDKDRKAAQQVLVKAEAAWDAQIELVNKAKAEHQGAVKARQMLEKAKTEGTTEQDIDAARESLRVAETNLEVFRAKTTADIKHNGVKTNQIIMEALGPEGIRMMVLTRKLTKLNNYIKPLADAFGLGSLEFDSELNCRKKHQSYGLLSRGAQFAVNTIIQVAIAKMDESAMVVIDGADVLIGGLRTGLIKMLVVAKIPALVSVATKSKEAAPDLSKGGYGKTYWLEGGEVK